jgi:TIGR03009 family protein
MMIARIGLAGACTTMVVFVAVLARAQVGSNPYPQYQPGQDQQAQTPPQQYAPPSASSGSVPTQPYQAPPYQSQQYPSQQNQPQQPQQQAPQPPLAQQYTAPPTPAPPPPIVLTPDEQAQLDRTLDEWERDSGKMTTFKCDFKKWHYDPTYLPPELVADKSGTPQLNEKAIQWSLGEIKYSTPDKGLIKESQVTTVDLKDPSKETTQNYGEYWACDGTSLYAVDYAKKEVHRTKLPPELQGKAITEGPLPFAFSTKAAELKHRYYMKVETPPDKTDQVWLQIQPRFQRDLANFVRVDVIFRASDMRPRAIQIVHNEQKVKVRNDVTKMVVAEDRDAYQFFDTWSVLPNINLLWSEFAPHPFGFKMIDETVTAPPAAPAPNPQARRQWPASNSGRPY